MAQEPSRCPACHASVQSEDWFCGECGNRLPEVCPSCGHHNSPGHKFCGRCGTALRSPSPPSTHRHGVPADYTPKHLAERILKSRAALEGERKPVTVLFCDIVNSTALAAALGPESMYHLLDAFFELCLPEIHRYDGTVNQFLGDGFMALFGAPLTHEQHARQAVMASLSILNAVRQAESRLPLPPGHRLPLRIGLNSGWVVVGKIGDNLRMDYTAVGDTTNVASRIQHLAETDTIVLTEATRALLRGSVLTEPIGPATVKGKVEPVVIHRVIGLAPRRAPMDSIGERQLTPFVGRGHDVATLTRLLEQAERGSGQLVGIVGEPGMGKSRLLLEFRQSITTRRLTYLEGRCVSYGSTIPYLPVLDLVRQNAGIADVDPPETAADKLQRALVEVGMNAEEGAPYLLSLLGLKAGSTALSGRSPESVKMRTFEVLRQLTLRGSRRRPIVLGLEDLQWVDRTSEELLSYLADALAGAPILAIATYRPGYRPAWLEKSYATQIALRPLSQEDSRALVQSVPQLEPPSDRLAAVIVTKGEGNPFVLEELVRTVSEQRALSGEATVPDTIQGVLMDRIDRLPDTARRVLQTASVIGREVPVSLLQAVWESPDDLRPTLEELTRLEFLYEDPGATETAYVFKHALTQEAVYASLLEASRRQQHQAVGLALERLYGARTGEIVELLAHHFSRSADVEKAVDYSLLAGEKAQRRWANAEALAYFEVALARLSSMPDTMPNSLRRIDAVVNQVEVKFALGRHGEQTRALEDIRDLVNRCGDARRRAAWHYWTGFLYAFTGGPLETAMRYCREAAGIADSENLIEVRAYADSCLAQVCFVAGKLADAMAAGVRALKTFEESGNVWWACRTLWILIMTANAMGEWERSLEFCRRALEHGRAVNDLRLKVVGWWRTGSTQIQRGDVNAGLACCQEALALSPIPFDAAMIRAMQGYGRIKEGDLDGGIAELEAAMDWFARSNLRYTRSGLVPILADGYRRQGKTTQAEAILREMLATARQSGYRYPEGVACRLLAACRAPENPGEATRLLDEACRILEEIGARNDLAKAWAALAEIQHASGDLSAAARLYGQALTMFEKLGTLDEVSRLREILGQGFGTR